MNQFDETDDTDDYYKFPFLMGQIMAMIGKKNVIKELKDRRVTDEEIKEFEKACEKIANSFYRDAK